VQLFQNIFEDFAQQKNLGNKLARYNFILNLDADERLSPELAESISNLKKDASGSLYYINRKNYFNGKWLRFGGNYPNKKIRLFDKTKASWQRKLHEKIVPIDSRTARHYLKGDIIHLAFDSLEQHQFKIKKYACTMAKHLKEKGVKSNLLKMLIKPAFLFFNMYFLRAGFLDGKLGYLYARNSAYAKYLRYKELRNLWKRN